MLWQHIYPCCVCLLHSLESASLDCAVWFPGLCTLYGSVACHLSPNPSRAPFICIHSNSSERKGSRDSLRRNWIPHSDFSAVRIVGAGTSKENEWPAVLTLRELCVDSDNDYVLLLVLMKIKQCSPLHCNSRIQWYRLSSFRYFNLYSSSTYGYNLQKHNSVLTKPSINSWRIDVVTKRYIHLGVDHTDTAEHVPRPRSYSRNCAASG